MSSSQKRLSLHQKEITRQLRLSGMLPRKFSRPTAASVILPERFIRQTDSPVLPSESTRATSTYVMPLLTLIQ
jgi:hypothetical protein